MSGRQQTLSVGHHRWRPSSVGPPWRAPHCVSQTRVSQHSAQHGGGIGIMIRWELSNSSFLFMIFESFSKHKILITKNMWTIRCTPILCHSIQATHFLSHSTLTKPLGQGHPPSPSSLWFYSEETRTEVRCRTQFLHGPGEMFWEVHKGAHHQQAREGQRDG